MDLAVMTEKPVIDKKKKILPMREPVVLNFKPDINQKLIDAAVDKALAKRFSSK